MMLQEIRNQVDFKHLKNNILFFLSGSCFALLIFYTEKMWLAVSAVCLIAAVFLSVYFKSMFSKFRKSPIALKIISILLALGGSCFFARRFVSNWLSLDFFKSVASDINISNTLLLSVMAGILALLSLLFLALIFNLILTELKKVILGALQFTKPKDIFGNIRRNLLLIFSSFAFMGLNILLTKGGFLSLLLSYILIVCVFSQVTGVIQRIKSIPWGVKIYAFISAVGICYYANLIFTHRMSVSSQIKRLFEKLNLNQTFFFGVLSAVLAFLAFAVIFVLVSLLLNYVTDKLKNVFRSLSKAELIIYSVMTAALLGFVCFAFFGSNAFWGTELNYDIIYTSDSSCLVNDNVYLRLYHLENDLRQPLFAVFAAPFVGFGYALSVPLSNFSPVFTPLLMNVIQILMLAAANLMLARMIKLDAIGRIFFMLFTTATYTTLLFSVMMEQYIVAYFWLIFVVYSFIEYKKASILAFSGAGGTLLTSLVLIPTTYESGQKNNTRKFRSFVTAMEKSVLGFLLILLACGRLNVLISFSDKTTQLSNFAGGGSIAERIKQYLSFISSCFISPDAVVDKTTYDHVSWQLSTRVFTDISIIGIVILALCLISFIVNRKNTLAKISALWICFSVVLLCAVGWGSAENGMILYSLYFGWAFIVLLFQLLSWCSEKLRFKYLTPIIGGAAAVIIAVCNYQGIKDLLSFAFTYYPV